LNKVYPHIFIIVFSAILAVASTVFGAKQAGEAVPFLSEQFMETVLIKTDFLSKFMVLQLAMNGTMLVLQVLNSRATKSQNDIIQSSIKSQAAIESYKETVNKDLKAYTDSITKDLRAYSKEILAYSKEVTDLAEQLNLRFDEHRHDTAEVKEIVARLSETNIRLESTCRAVHQIKLMGGD